MPNICVIGESDPFVAQLLQRFAEERGLQAVRASTSQDVMSLIQQNEPVVVVIDLELPGEVRGWEVIRRMWSDPRFATMPVISCSWMGKAKANSLIGGLAGHMKKPELHYEDFLVALRVAGVADSTIPDGIQENLEQG